MIARHWRREAAYRQPFGAVPTSSPVYLAVSIQELQENVQDVKLCYAYGLYEFFSTKVQMVRRQDEEDCIWFEHTLEMAGEANLLFYWFELKTTARRCWLVPDPASLTGGSRLVSQEPRVLAQQPIVGAFQITVYDAAFRVPAFMQGGIMYQIFPDRFCRGSGYDEARMEALTSPHDERIWHRDWEEDVDFKGRPPQGYLALDFYGGSLKGIEEKLDYIESLGVTILYLNPVFEARSNHRYDTGDYEKIDRMLGTTEDFQSLCEAARARGIRLLLDGVFSHTGADSRYFNRYGRYPDVGAWQAAKDERLYSPWSSWYRFDRRGEALFYDAWWGFTDLPNVNEYDLDYRRFITGEDGVLRRWQRAGASGYRLDVSDELPDGFIRAIRRAVRKEDPEAVILGEIWEDASAKTSYGSYRDFLLGNTHDCVMGYPFQKALLGWLTFEHGAEVLANQLENLRENYPPAAFYASMNLLGSHDTPRALTVLSGEPDPGSRAAQAPLRLKPEQRALAARRLRLALLFAAAFPGTLSIYYGDEAGLEGYRDPFNRRTYPWGREDQALLAAFRAIGKLRRDHPVLGTGYYRLHRAEGDLFVLERWLEDGHDFFGRAQTGASQALIALNRGQQPVTFGWQGKTDSVAPLSARVFLDGDDQALKAVFD